MPDESVTTLSMQVRLTAQTAPDRPAITIGAQTINYVELDRIADRAASALRREGITPGAPIAILGQNSIHHVALMVGATRIGAVIVPLPISAETSSIAMMLKDCEASLCFTMAGSGLESSGIRFVGLGKNEFEEWLPRTSPQIEDHQPDETDRCTIIYSSGTTGTPKGIVQPHLYRSRLLRGGPARGYAPDAVTLLATPLYSNTTLASFLQTGGVGGHIVMMTKFEAGEWLALAEKNKATHAMLVPVMIDRILNHPAFDTTDLSSFRMKYCTSAPFAASLKREVLNRWPGGLIEFYGMTEGGASFVLKAHEHPDKLHTVGQVGPGGEILILTDDGKEAACGEPGEVVSRAPGTMLGYHNRPDATAEAFWTAPDGHRWLRTGDIGKLDKDGFLSIVDRKKDMIISGGFNIYPADIEAVMRQHPEIREVSVVGVPSDQWGETPVAFVVGSTLPAEQLKDWLNSRVGKMQRVADVVVVNALPRNAIGKVLKRELKDFYMSSCHL